MKAALRIAAALAVPIALSQATAQRADAYVAPGATVLSSSLGRLELGDDTTQQVALSSDGRFAAFSTRARNLFEDSDPDPPGFFRAGGIFRRDLATGTISLVAPGDLRRTTAPDVALVRGSLNPALSADGRYVAFSTGWNLSPDDTNGHVDVYVRDMALPIDDPAAFDLVSARNGASAGARWRPPAIDRPGRNGGAEVTLSNSISADGRIVVFRTATGSDLPSSAEVDTPGQQVFVRDRRDRTTTLVTALRDGSGPISEGLVNSPVVSADGSTVAWVGRRGPEQTRFLAGESPNADYEYLYLRRVADGAAAVTRRVTGIVDLDDPACDASSTIIDDPDLSGPCYGPLGQVESYVGGITSQVPVLNSDGSLMMFITNAGMRRTPLTGNQGDVFLVETSSAKSRKLATTELTREASIGIGVSEAIENVEMSDDGRWAVLTTSRTSFALPALRLVGSPRPNAIARELYLVDLKDRTIERILRGWNGEDTDGSVSSLPAISGDGSRIAFISAATNLFFGDANDRTDAFLVRREADDGGGGGGGDPEPVELVAATTVASREHVAFRVSAPMAGALRIVVRGRAVDARGRPTGPVRTLASISRWFPKAEARTVQVRIGASFRAGLKRAGRIPATADLAFGDVEGGSHLRTLTATFRK